MNIKPKYKIGQKVFGISDKVIQKQHPCPDCLGEEVWTAKSPAGKDFTFVCPRCGPCYRLNPDLSLNYSAHNCSVVSLTIGSVRIDTEDKPPVSYMCRETGVGCGTLYKETQLYASRDDASLEAKEMELNLDNEVDWVVEQYTKTLKLSDYQVAEL